MEAMSSGVKGDAETITSDEKMSFKEAYYNATKDLKCK